MQMTKGVTLQKPKVTYRKLGVYAGGIAKSSLILKPWKKKMILEHGRNRDIDFLEVRDEVQEDETSDKLVMDIEYNQENAPTKRDDSSRTCSSSSREWRLEKQVPPSVELNILGGQLNGDQTQHTRGQEQVKKTKQGEI